jgi:hypothetical protein
VRGGAGVREADDHEDRTFATAAPAALALSTAPPAAAETGFDLGDFPKLPAAADPAAWRCEVLFSQATMSFGTVGDLRLGTMRPSFGEGTMDGRYAQVSGALRSEPTPVPGLPGTSLRLRHAGYSDFQSGDERKEAIDLTAAFESPLLPRNCGSGPIQSVKQSDGPTRWSPPTR